MALWTLSGITWVSQYQNQSGSLKQETVSGSGISWAICKYAPCPRQITMPVHITVFTIQKPFLPPNQQRQSTEGMTMVFKHLQINSENMHSQKIKFSFSKQLAVKINFCEVLPRKSL